MRPLLVLRDGTLIAGERTLRAAELAGLTHVDVKILEGEPKPGQVKKLQLIENLMREGLKDSEVYLGLKEMEAQNPGMLKKDLAAELHFDPSMATKILAVDDLIAPAKEAFLNGAFGFTVAYEIARANPEEQLCLLAMRMAGASRDSIETARKSRKAQETPAGRVNSLRCPLPSGTTVIIKGQSITL